SLQRELQMEYLEQVRQQEARSFALFHADSRSDADDAQKRQALDALNTSTAYLRTVGDLLLAAFFNGKKPKDRDELKQLYLAATLQHSSADELKEELAEPLESLRDGEKGIQPLHWQLAFPDVFGRSDPGFDVFVGNPPFAGNNTLIQGYPEGILDWFKRLHPESGGQCDLVAHFFRRCFQLLRPGGALGLIATNTIAQGDTRSSGLRWICLNGGTIYAARKRHKWPGVAAVVVSVVHLLKGQYNGLITLNHQAVDRITAFLLGKGGHEDPRVLAANQAKSFMGSKTYGQGFTFDNSDQADDETPGLPSPIATLERLIADDTKNAEVIFPYLGGEEVNNSPTQAHHRYVINFGDLREDECRRDWPDLMGIVERKVRPERETNNREGYRRYWWHHGEKRPGLYRAIAGCKRVFVTARIQSNWQLTFMPPTSIFSEAMVVFAIESPAALATLQSTLHELWARFLGSSMKDDLRYTPTDCFETFPFPAALLDSAASDPAHETTRQSLEAIGERYHQFRADLMVRNNEGLTSTYNRFHDPAETSSGLLELRDLHGEMDQAVLAAYDWSDVPTACGFGLDYLDTEEDVQLPDGLQERIDSGDLFFWDAGDALDFQGQLQAYGAITGRRKLLWRYRWPDAVRDDVLARLLALNAERYAEEVAQGLHGKGGRKPAADSAAGGKRRGRPPKASQPGETERNHSEQMGLAL
ncbi:MAG: Eco57I restriction-modification methylase domain-containing protein, partial [Synechococcus sp.]